MSTCNTCKRPPSKFATNDDGRCLYRMSDGRHFTDYNTSCHTYDLLRTNNKLGSSYSTRMFLMRNANKMIEENMKYSIDRNACPCFDDKAQGTMLPQLDKIRCNANYCTFSKNDKNGLGLGIDARV